MAEYSFAKAFGGDTSTTGKPATVTSIGQLLDLYVVHLVFTIIFVVGGLILADKYGENASKPFTAWSDLFFAIGLIAGGLNVAFGISLFIAWINKTTTALSRDDDTIHWLHALSMLAAASGAVWGVLALILTFGSTLVGATTDDTEVAGYFMIILTTAYFIYLCVRYFSGLAGKSTSTLPPTTINSDLKTYLEGINNASRGITASQPLFGGAGGAAAFGGIDLSGLQPSSMSTLPPVQAAQACSPQVPMMIIPPVMMAPQAACQPDPTKIHLG